MPCLNFAIKKSNVDVSTYEKQWPISEWYLTFVLKCMFGIIQSKITWFLGHILLPLLCSMSLISPNFDIKSIIFFQFWPGAFSQNCWKRPWYFRHNFHILLASAVSTSCTRSYMTTPIQTNFIWKIQIKLTSKRNNCTLCCCLVGLRFYVPVNSYGHVVAVSSSNHTFSLASLTKWLTVLHL